MRRLFWLGLGFAAGVAATRRATRAAHQFTPAGITGNLASVSRNFAQALGSFGADVRAASLERELQLRNQLDNATTTAISARRAPKAGKT